MSEPGAYLVLASMRADFVDSNNVLIAENFLLSDLVLLTRKVSGGYEVTVRSGDSGRAVKGVDVSLYRFDYKRGHQEMERKRTGDDGRVDFDQARWKNDQFFIMARRIEELALDGNRLSLRQESDRGVSSSALLYTDRSVYRPQQALKWKAVAYRGGGEEVEYSTTPDTASG